MIPAKGEKLDIPSSSENIRLVERLVEDVCMCMKQKKRLRRA